MTTDLQGPALAAAILENIEDGASETFGMSDWFWPGAWPVPGAPTTLAPSTEPECGTTMCAAGWAAHLTGWVLVLGDEYVLMTDGKTELRTYAEKDGVRRNIADVAREALGLKGKDTFWYAPNTTALERLREIAGQETTT